MSKLDQLTDDELKDKLDKQALRDPRTPREFKIRNDWERVRRILIRRYKRFD